MRFEMPKLTFWKVVLVVILIAGAFGTVVRFTKGLGPSTNLSDEFPWGLWVGFDLLCGVMLAASPLPRRCTSSTLSGFVRLSARRF
jgi:Ni/Fe-hydrogenase subunit HybB-like protein